MEPDLKCKEREMQNKVKNAKTGKKSYMTSSLHVI